MLEVRQAHRERGFPLRGSHLNGVRTMDATLTGTRITEVRLKLAGSNESNKHMLGYVAVILNGDLRIGEIKVIYCDNGRRFVSFPSRMVKRHCAACDRGIAVRYHFCPECGAPQEPVSLDNGERVKLYADVAHPISAKLREQFERIILGIVDLDEACRSRGGYRSSYDYPYAITWNSDGSYRARQSMVKIEAREDFPSYSAV